MGLQQINVKMRLRRIIAVSFFISGIISGTWASRIPEMQQKFQLNDAKWGSVLFAIPIGMFVGLPLSSWLVAKFTSYKTVAFSGVVYSLLLCLIPFAPNVYVVAALLFCFGVSRNFLNISINTNSVELQKFYNKPIIASFHGIWSLACLVAAGIGTALIWARIQPEYHFIFIAVLSIIIITVLRIRRKRPRETGQKRPLFVKPDKHLVWLGIICFCTMMCEGTMMDWSVNYFTRVIESDRQFVTLGYTAFIIAMTTGRFIGDNLIQRFGAYNILIIDGLLMAIGFAIATLFPYLIFASAGFLLIGFGNAILVPVLYSLAGKNQKMPPSFAIASVTMLGYVGFLLAPIVIGNMSEAFGMRSAFALMILFATSISIIAFGMKRKSMTGVT